MATFCIPKFKIDKLKKVFSELSSKNKLEELIAMSPENRIKLFSKQLTEEESVLLNRELERAIASEKVNALRNWVRKNLDVKYREGQISMKQRSSIRKFIEDNMYPVKKRTEIIPISELKSMSDEEFASVVKKNFKESDYQKIRDEFKVAIKKSKEMAESKGRIKMSLKEKKAKIQRRIIEKYIENKKKDIKRVSVPMKEILTMNEEKRLAFLKKIMPENEATKLNSQISERLSSDIEKEMAEKLKSFKSLKDFNNFIDSRLNKFASLNSGIGLTKNEVDNVIKLTSDIKAKKDLLDKSPFDKAAQFEYGKARGQLREYVTQLKSEGKQSFRDVAMNIVGAQRMVQLGIDLGTTLIQGAGMITEKAAWRANLQGVKNAFSKKELESMKFRMLGHPLYDQAEKAGLRLPLYGTELFRKEEMAMFNNFKTKYGGKFIKKGLGAVNETLDFFERYVASLSQARFDVFTQIVESEKALKGVAELDSKELKDIAEAINTISGSTKLSILGRDFEKIAPEANVLMLSARLFVSKFKNMIGTPVLVLEHYTKKSLGQETRLSDTVVKKRLRAFMGILGVSTSLISLAKLSGYDVETDPRSGDFGKATVGNRKVDLTLGYGSYVTYMARIATGETKTSSTGVVKQLTDLTEEEKKAGAVRAKGSGGENIGYGDITGSFLRNKLATFPSIFLDFFLNETNMGDKPTVKGEISDRFPPLFLKDTYDIIQDDKMGTLEKIPINMLSFVGIGGYSKSPEDLTVRDSKEMTGFIKKVGKEEALKASEWYSREVDKKISDIRKTKEYSDKTNADKQKEISSVKEQVKQDMFSKYEYYP